MNLPQQFPFVRASAGPAPLRRPGSIRRTTTIDSDWPDGLGQSWVMEGRARDFLTPLSGDPIALAEAHFRIKVSPIREILEIDATPAHPDLAQLVGVRAGGASRKFMAATLEDLRGTPLFQVLDDFAGTSLVASWIWSQWLDDWTAKLRSSGMKPMAGKNGNMTNICTGFAEGATSLAADGGPISGQPATPVGPLENPDDLMGWHPLAEQQGRPLSRRARRIDVWRVDNVLKVDAAFQDSGSTPQGGRAALHEYRVHAEIDEETETLLSLQALPLVLPYRECPGASIKATRMIGQPIRNFRRAVLDTLIGPMGCTHLNDVLRALADVPALAENLPRES